MFQKFFLVVVTSALCACASTPDEPENEQLGPYEQQSRAELEEPTVVTYDDFNDPVEPVNRVFFKFNDVLYRYLLTPLSKGYITVVPDPARDSVSNLFLNLREPLFSLNNLFQGEFGKSGTSIVRFGINSTVGLLGLFDPAEAWWGIERARTNFGHTLAYHGVGYGAYFVIPLIGPSNVRDGATMAFEYMTHPVHYLAERPYTTYYFLAEGFQELSPTLKDYPQILKDTEDPYEFMRNLYLQRLLRDDEEIRERKESKKQNSEAGADTGVNELDTNTDSEQSDG